MKKTRLATIELFRVIFMAGVVFGHIYCYLYQAEYFAKFGRDWIGIQNMCVDGFFMIAGTFLAMAIKDGGDAKFRAWLTFNKKRTKRLWYPLVFASVLACLVNVLTAKASFLDAVLALWPTILFLGGIGGMKTVCDAYWYISVLFWCTLFFSALLIFCKKKISNIICAILAIGNIAFMFYLGHLSFTGSPLLFGFFSVGFMRGFGDIALGILISELSKKNITVFDKKVVTACVEIIAFILMIVSFFHGDHSRYDFLIYPAWICLLLIFLQQKECVFAFAKNEKTSERILVISTATLYIYLLHPLVLQVISFYQLQTMKPKMTVYIVCMAICFLIGIITNQVVMRFTKKG